MDRFRPNFVYAFILTRSRLGLLPVIFRIFVTELWSLIYIRISFLLNILWTNGESFFYNLCIHIVNI